MATTKTQPTTAADKLSTDNPNDLADNDVGEEIKLPGIIATAFATDRPELAKLWKGPMTAQEAEAMAHAFGVLLKRNGQLRNKLARLRETIANNIIQLSRQIRATVTKLNDVDKDARDILGIEDADEN